MYSGLIIGGPFDGKMLEHRDNMYRHPKQPGSYKVQLKADGTPSVYQPDSYVEYIYVGRYWLPYNIRDGVPSILVALEILEQEYRSKRHG